MQGDRARAMRKQPSAAESAVWAMVRNRKLGAKFRRQFPIDTYITDFASVEAKLVIEVDGSSHDVAAQAAYDDVRTARLEALGWRVVRVRDVLIISDPRAAAELIRQTLKG
jgi:very-short-patch-repair endonuclease